MDKPDDDTLDSAEADEALALKPLTPRELEKIARGQAQIDSGWAIYGPELEAWLDAMENTDAMPPPPPARRLEPRS